MKNLIYLLVIGVLVMSCGEVEVADNVLETDTNEPASQENLYKEIISLHETMLYDDLRANKVKGNELFDLTIVFLKRFPEVDSRFEVMEYGRAAATGSDNLQGADRLLKMMIEEFPEHPLRPEKMSLRAFTLWKLNNIEGSTRMYNQIIKEYPDTEWSADAEGSLMMNNLNTDDGKLPDYFEKPNS
jgi:outer membrane protein assembly factor BamD (BamD/ComL family)